MRITLPHQGFLIRRWTSQARTEIDVSSADCCIRSIGKSLAGRFYDLLGCLLALPVIYHGLANGLLKVQWAFLQTWVHFAIGKDAGIDVLLSGIAEVFVLGHDPLVDLIDQIELRVSGILIAEDFVSHGRRAWATWHEPLNHEEMWPASVSVELETLEQKTYETLVETLGKK